MTNNKLPKRKHPRLKEYDYSQKGYYFVTICSEGRSQIFSEVVGRGLAPAENKLTAYGRIIESELFNLENRYNFLKIDKYVIMPNHLHVIFEFAEQKIDTSRRTTAGASPRPTTLMDVVGAFKSISTLKCKRIKSVGKIFQDSFYDTVIRSEQDYLLICKYIDENIIKWNLDKYY